jgi:hypothetical protein
MVIENVNMDQANWYCEHDHPVVGEDLKALVEHYGALDVYGRAPGVGDLNIVIFPHPKAVSEKQ